MSAFADSIAERSGLAAELRTLTPDEARERVQFVVDVTRPPRCSSASSGGPRRLDLQRSDGEKREDSRRNRSGGGWWKDRRAPRTEEPAASMSGGGGEYMFVFEAGKTRRVMHLAKYDQGGMLFAALCEIAIPFNRYINEPLGLGRKVCKKCERIRFRESA